MAIKQVTWVCTWVTEHSAFVEIPDDIDIEDLEQDYAIYDALMQLKADRPENSSTREFLRDEIEWSDTDEGDLDDSDEVETLDLKDYKF